MGGGGGGGFSLAGVTWFFIQLSIAHIAFHSFALAYGWGFGLDSSDLAAAGLV